MTENEILLRACEIWLERMLADEVKVLDENNAVLMPWFKVPPGYTVMEWADKLLRDDNIVYKWLLSEKSRIEKEAT